MNKEFDFDLVKGDTKKTLTEQKDFDIAYLDGGHSFETVKHDYNMCKQLPVVVFDDYFTKDEGGKEVADEHKGTIKSLINLIKNIDEKFSTLVTLLKVVVLLISLLLFIMIVLLVYLIV